MEHPGLRLDVDGAIASIVFDRPDRANAIDTSWLPAIAAFLRRVEHDDAIRCVLIRAEGRHFQAGGDLAFDLEQPTTDLIGYAQDIMQSWNRVLIALHDLPKPVIAAVQGGTIGASIALVAACDLVLAADDAFFILAQTKIGASLDGLPSYFLPRKIGLSRAMEWTLLAERIDADTALRAGLVTRVVPAGELKASAEAMCARLAQGATRALGLSKRLLHASLDNDIHAQAALETRLYAEIVASEDWKEGIAPFMAKRPPAFKGR